MPMGPEALMVRSKMDARLELAEFMRLEYSRGDATSVEAEIRAELDLRPRAHPLARRLQRWTGRLLRRPEADPAEALAARTPMVPMPQDYLREGRTLAGATLASLPAARAAVGPGGKATPITAVPVLSRS